jgi:DNA-directed RNA polymerase specialized sigma24 family protein
MSFPTTHWTLLAEATLNGDTRGRSALEQMCRDYHRPVFVVLRARGYPEQEAEDLTQEFFLRLFESQAWKRADRGKGRFRSFLLGTLTHMLQHLWTAGQRQKRGGGAPTESLEVVQENGEMALAEDDADMAMVFDREWALRLIQSAFAKVEAEFEEAGRAGEFAVLRRFLPGVELPLRYEEAARLLGRSEGLVKSMIHRLRDDYRRSVRGLVARTVSAAHEVDEELAYLHEVLAAPPRDAT